MIDDLLISYLEAKSEKNKCVKSARYDEAAKYRDDEKNLSERIFRLLNPDDLLPLNLQLEAPRYVAKVATIGQNRFEDFIREYFQKEFNCDIDNSDICLKNINRQKKLKDIGI